MVRRLLRGPQQVTQGVLRARKPPAGDPGAPPRRAAGGVLFFAIYALIYARKPSNKLQLNASRTSKRRVSGCLGMSWRRNELMTLTLPKSGVARTDNCSMLR